MNNWLEIGSIDDIPQLGSRIIERSTGNIAVFRTAKNEIFALNDACPHKGGPLSQGIVHGTKVTCPLHNWVIGLEDGTAVAPDEGCVHTHPVKVEKDKIYINIS